MCLWCVFFWLLLLVFCYGVWFWVFVLEIIYDYEERLLLLVGFFVLNESCYRELLILLVRYKGLFCIDWFLWYAF